MKKKLLKKTCLDRFFYVFSHLTLTENICKKRPTNEPTEGLSLYAVLAWEPSTAKVTKSYSRRLPAFKRFYRENEFSLF